MALWKDGRSVFDVANCLMGTSVLKDINIKYHVYTVAPYPTTVASDLELRHPRIRHHRCLTSIHVFTRISKELQSINAKRYHPNPALVITYSRPQGQI